MGQPGPVRRHARARHAARGVLGSAVRAERGPVADGPSWHSRRAAPVQRCGAPLHVCLLARALHRLRVGGLRQPWLPRPRGKVGVPWVACIYLPWHLGGDPLCPPVGGGFAGRGPPAVDQELRAPGGQEDVPARLPRNAGGRQQAGHLRHPGDGLRAGVGGRDDHGGPARQLRQHDRDGAEDRAQRHRLLGPSRRLDAGQGLAAVHPPEAGR
mmetsp:Transcript_47279/g.148540  ORF Transcript_47279/g.148540 Transcript_47279/m.148540 type:complete len:212 (-) Transcript_47279:630-1265(-)